MQVNMLKRIIIVCFLLVAASACSDKGSKAGEEKVVKGLKDIGKGTGNAFKKGGKEVGLGLKQIGKEVGQETKKTGRTFGEWVKDASNKTGEAFRKVGRSFKGLFKRGDR
jgi:hypothetical protein